MVLYNCVSFPLAGALVRFVQHTLAQYDLWKGSFIKVKESLRSCQELCERWSQSCDTLTTQFWKRYAPHPWKGEKFVSEHLNMFAKRLEEVRPVKSNQTTEIYLEASFGNGILFV